MVLIFGWCHHWVEAIGSAVSAMIVNISYSGHWLLTASFVMAVYLSLMAICAVYSMYTICDTMYITNPPKDCLKSD